MEQNVLKATGIVRRLDKLNRFVLPIEILRTRGIKPRDPMEVFITNRGDIVLRPYRPACVFCGEDGAVTVNGLHVCQKHVEEIQHQCTRPGLKTCDGCDSRSTVCPSQPVDVSAK